MAEKELRRLKRKELLEMLLVQCRETERLQQESEEAKTELAVLKESYERLKIKLNVKDERLNQKDAKIAELNRTIREMQESKTIELEKAGSIAEAALRLNGIFELAQQCADQYLMNVKALSEKYPVEAEELQKTEEIQRIEERQKIEEAQKIEERQEIEEIQETAESPEEVRAEAEQRKQAAAAEESHGERVENRKQIPFDPVWKSGSRKRQGFFSLRKGTGSPEMREDGRSRAEAGRPWGVSGELHG